MSEKIALCCATCGAQASFVSEQGRERAIAAGWRMGLDPTKQAWCPAHAEEALNGKDARW